MQNSEEAEGDVLTDPAFVLLGLPIKDEGTEATEGGYCGVEDEEVDVVA